MPPPSDRRTAAGRTGPPSPEEGSAATGTAGTGATATGRPGPRASIVLPTLEGEHELRQLLPALSTQILDGGFELLAIDSDSRDGTRALLEDAGASVDRIDRAEFSHGGTRNRAASAARGEFLVFLSQDVVPVGDRFLEALIAPFEDPRVAGVCARVLPLEDSDLLTRRTVLDLPEAGDAPWAHDLDDVAGLWELPPEERVRRIRFNNVASAVRRCVFEDLPLPTLDFGEDFGWAARALTAGHRLAFAPAAVVRHAHRYEPRSAFRRYRTDARFHRESHGWRVRPTVGSALRGVAYELLADWRAARREGVLRHLPDLARAPLLRGAQVAGQLAGSRGWGAARDTGRRDVGGRVLRADA